MKRLLWLAAALAAGVGSAGAEGFLVFSTEGVAHYAPDAKGKLAVAGRAPSGSIDDYFTVKGRIYRLEKILGKVSELKADLTPLREAEVRSKTGVPDWLGSWEKGLLLLCDNAVLYFDGSLKLVGRTALEPRKSGEAAPALGVRDFAPWGGRGYLLANTGEVFVLPLSRPSPAAVLRAEVSVPYELSTEGLWIDLKDRTLNVLAASREEQRGNDLDAGRFRLIKQQRVLSYSLDQLKKAPRSAVVHEEREIHEGFQGEVADRLPPYRKESSSGTYIGVRSRTTPAYAETFVEAEGPVPPRRVMRLKTLGRLEPVGLQRDSEEGSLFFLDGKRRLYVEPDLAEHVLRLQPGLYGELQRLPGLRLDSFKTLAY